MEELLQKLLKPICIVPNCTRKQYARGLCRACTYIVKRRIKSGIITEEELINNGLLLKQSRNYSKSSPMSIAIQKLKG